MCKTYKRLINACLISIFVLYKKGMTVLLVNEKFEVKIKRLIQLFYIACDLNEILPQHNKIYQIFHV